MQGKFRCNCKCGVGGCSELHLPKCIYVDFKDKTSVPNKIVLNSSTYRQSCMLYGDATWLQHQELPKPDDVAKCRDVIVCYEPEEEGGEGGEA